MNEKDYNGNIKTVTEEKEQENHKTITDNLKKILEQRIKQTNHVNKGHQHINRFSPTKITESTDSIPANKPITFNKKNSKDISSTNNTLDSICNRSKETGSVKNKPNIKIKPKCFMSELTDVLNKKIVSKQAPNDTNKSTKESISEKQNITNEKMQIQSENNINAKNNNEELKRINLHYIKQKETPCSKKVFENELLEKFKDKKIESPLTKNDKKMYVNDIKDFVKSDVDSDFDSKRNLVKNLFDCTTKSTNSVQNNNVIINEKVENDIVNKPQNEAEYFKDVNKNAVIGNKQTIFFNSINDELGRMNIHKRKIIEENDNDTVIRDQTKDKNVNMSSNNDKHKVYNAYNEKHIHYNDQSMCSNNNKHKMNNSYYEKLLHSNEQTMHTQLSAINKKSYSDKNDIQQQYKHELNNPFCVKDATSTNNHSFFDHTTSNDSLYNNYIDTSDYTSNNSVSEILKATFVMNTESKKQKNEELRNKNISICDEIKNYNYKYSEYQNTKYNKDNVTTNHFTNNCSTNDYKNEKRSRRYHNKQNTVNTASNIEYNSIQDQNPFHNTLQYPLYNTPHNSYSPTNYIYSANPFLREYTVENDNFDTKVNIDDSICSISFDEQNNNSSFIVYSSENSKVKERKLPVFRYNFEEKYKVNGKSNDIKNYSKNEQEKVVKQEANSVIYHDKIQNTSQQHRNEFDSYFENSVKNNHNNNFDETCATINIEDYKNNSNVYNNITSNDQNNNNTFYQEQTDNNYSTTDIVRLTNSSIINETVTYKNDVNNNEYLQHGIQNELRNEIKYIKQQPSSQLQNSVQQTYNHTHYSINHTINPTHKNTSQIYNHTYNSTSQNNDTQQISTNANTINIQSHKKTINLFTNLTTNFYSPGKIIYEKPILILSHFIPIYKEKENSIFIFKILTTKKSWFIFKDLKTIQKIIKIKSTENPNKIAKRNNEVVDKINKIISTNLNYFLLTNIIKDFEILGEYLCIENKNNKYVWVNVKMIGNNLLCYKKDKLMYNISISKEIKKMGENGFVMDGTKIFCGSEEERDVWVDVLKNE
ncbi:hypothetical protein BDAP_000006 [Binucleata daphniae]